MPKKRSVYVIPKHLAGHLYYDFRLEFNGTLKSWAISKGPNLNPKHKRLAIAVEDQVLAHAHFEEITPAGSEAGIVMLWDQGYWQATNSTLCL